MKKSKFLLVFLMATLFIGFTACSDDDDDIAELKVGKNAVDVEVGTSATIKITSGNGEYTVTSAKEETAEASEKNGEITIKGIAVGSTTVTVKDREGKTASISVNVISEVGAWTAGEAKIEVEGVSTEDAAAIKEELDARKAIKSITLEDEGTFEMVKEGESGDVTITGTYTYEDKVLTFIEDTPQPQTADADTWSVKVVEITKTSLKVESDQTEELKADYPDLTKAIETYSFTRE